MKKIQSVQWPDIANFTAPIIITVMLLISLNTMANELSHSALEQQTIAIVDQQLAAYNNRDIEAFAATYHDDVEIHGFSGGLQMQGKAALIERYGKMFSSVKCLQATSLKRIVEGRFLVDHELAQRCYNDATTVDQEVKVIASYEVVDGLIKRVVFMRN